MDYKDGVYEPFVYEIRDVVTGKGYIGSRTRRGCLLSDLGSKYFTSSSEVKDLWINDPERFLVTNIVPCDSSEEALDLELHLIKKKNAVKDNTYYNKGHPYVGFNTCGSGHPHTDEHKQRLSKKYSGASNPFYGKRHSDLQKEKWSKNRSGKNNPNYGKTWSQPQEVKDKISASMKGHRYKTEMCPHCKKECPINVIKRWHYDNCKFRDSPTI